MLLCLESDLPGGINQLFFTEQVILSLRYGLYGMDLLAPVDVFLLLQVLEGKLREREVFEIAFL